jgi:hypothetical protein
MRERVERGEILERGEGGGREREGEKGRATGEKG